MIPWVKFRSPIRFGDQFTMKRYYEGQYVPAYRAQTVPYAVAPQVRLRINERLVFGAGEEVTPEVFAEADRPEVNLCDLIDSGAIIEKRDPEGTAA